MKNKILIAEISGKRPGGVNKRHTESFDWNYDHVIISNNSEGYETDWNVVNVPEDYQNWYKENVATNDSSYYAPMNRSYAIKYAKDHGYKYLVQLDDNIMTFDIKYLVKRDGVQVKYTTLAATPNKENLQNDMIKYMELVLDLTNVGMVGMAPDSNSVPQDDWLKERYVYSAFMLNLEIVPPIFQGDFEDDIEYRMKLKQAGIPSLEIVPFHYSKTAQDKHNGKEDVTGNRQAYKDAGLDRGKVMSELYGDMYSRGWSDQGSGIKRIEGQRKFRHKIKPFKVGVRVKSLEILKQVMLELFDKYATERKDSLKTSVVFPKKIFNLLVTDDNARECILSNIIELCIKYEMDIVEPNADYNALNTYSILFSGDQEKLTAVRNEMKLAFDFEGVQIIDS